MLDAGCGFGRTVGVLARDGLRRGRRRHLAGGDRGGGAAQPRPRRTSSHDLTQPLPDDGRAVRRDRQRLLVVRLRRDASRTTRRCCAPGTAALKPGGALVMELSDIERSQARLGPLGDGRRPRGRRRRTSTSTCDPGDARAARHDTWPPAEQTLDVDTRLYEAGRAGGDGRRRPASATCGATAASTAHPKQPTDRLVLVARA